MTEPIVKTVWIDAAPSVVFEFFVDADKHVRWSGVAARLEPVPGGVYELDMGDAGVMRGRFVEVERPTRVVYEVDPPEGMDLPPSRVEISLAEEVSGTRVTVAHHGLAPPFMPVASRGWDHHLARLSVASEGGQPGPDSLCHKPLAALMDAEPAS